MPLTAEAGVVYRCSGAGGIPQFVTAVIPGKECKQVVYNKGDWTYLGKSTSGTVFSAKSANVGSTNSIAQPSIWYKTEYEDSEMVLKSELYLVKIKCASSQISEMQSVTNYRDGRISTTGAGDTRYAVPDTSDEAIVKFACQGSK